MAHQRPIDAIRPSDGRRAAVPLEGVPLEVIPLEVISPMMFDTLTPQFNDLSRHSKPCLGSYEVPPIS